MLIGGIWLIAPTVRNVGALAGDQSARNGGGSIVTRTKMAKSSNSLEISDGIITRPD
jgi:hypothetical protein